MFSSASTPARVDAVRRFNRFYTRQMGLLHDRLLRLPFTLTEARVLYEVAIGEPLTATRVGETLGLDAGYLSRLLRGLEARGLVERRPAERDARRLMLTLTPAGRDAFAALDDASRRDVGALLERLGEPAREQLVRAMTAIERLLDPAAEPRVPYLIRPPRSGDLGWVVQRHGALYAQEYGWDERFEGLVAGIVAQYVEHLDAARERCWIAEREEENVGCIFLVRHPERAGVARLRLLLVEPSARGLGIGRRLVQECTRFARQAGYHTITLWTNSVLHAARAIYQAEGYQLVEETPHHSFGRDLVGQTWELAL
ncbi:MAG TPA: bifunctional helix-turn-helix transcriptional regulator/GNAT family N-acetyltransferase [Gemmatimonadaceae bacterium]|nr:bifunctional helix-turn-helix transcriptional regulator/GNAT family N-acetyltransferase [Gemmatimonadaceae bacterium]